MTDKEKQEFDTLYRHVKKLMGYDENQALTREMILRLKGLAEGKYIANSNVPSKANYSYSLIYHTFLFCSSDIKWAFEKRNFKDDKHKFNYMLKIIETHINDVYKKEKESNKTSIVERHIDNGINGMNDNGFKAEEKKEHKTTIQDDWW